MTNDVAGKVVLVTGASKGIVAGIAMAFGAAGAKVAVGYARDREILTVSGGQR
jgi:NAD(P)-dependent dehydrogenase (short-subunit alcohol dehydrogenase family)